MLNYILHNILYFTINYILYVFFETIIQLINNLYTIYGSRPLHTEFKSAAYFQELYKSN